MVPDGWRVDKLADWLVEHREKSTAQDQHVALTSSRAGLVTQAEYYGQNRITKRDNIGFHVVPPSYLTYRSRSDDDEYYFNRNLTGQFGIVSHFYPVFNFPRGDDRFFYYYLNHFRHRMAAYAVGSSQKVLSLNALRGIALPIPPLPEQKKIADILATWDKAIEIAGSLLANAEKQKRALIEQLLTRKWRMKGLAGEWKDVRLEEVATVDSRSLGSKTPPEFEFDYISLSNVEPGRIVGPLEHMRFGDAPSRARRVVKSGDVLVSTVRPNLLGFARVSDEYSDCVASTGFAVLSASRKADGAYLFHYLFSHHMISQFHALVVGSNYPAINSSDVKKLQIKLPPLDEQRQIGRLLDNCDAEIACLKSDHSQLRVEQRALMQQLLTGKRRVTV